MAKKDDLPLTKAQKEIMEVVWREEEVTVSKVRDALSSKRELARNTVQTMMVRLEERDWLKHRKKGRTFYYSAKRPRKSSLGVHVSQMIDKLFAGSAEEMVTALIEHRGLTSEEAKRIQKMINKAKTKKQ